MLNKYDGLKIVLCAAFISDAFLLGVPYSLQEKINVNAFQEKNYPESAIPSPQEPLIRDHTLKVELVLKGLTYATDMAFLDPDNILVTEKDTGIVRRVLNGVCYKNLCLMLMLQPTDTEECWVLPLVTTIVIPSVTIKLAPMIIMAVVEFHLQITQI